MRQPDGGFICDDLDRAPDGLEVDFLKVPTAPDGDDAGWPAWRSAGFVDFVELADSRLLSIQRAIPGPFVVDVLDGPSLHPVSIDVQAIRLPDGSIQVPACYSTAILVPQDGRIIDAVHAANPGVAILVTDIIRPGQRTRLFQVR